MEFGENVCKRKKTQTKLRSILFEDNVTGSSLRKKDLSSDELDTFRTANEEVQTNEEAQVYVQNLDLFVTVQFLDETSPVMSLGKLCSEHGYSCEWKKR